MELNYLRLRLFDTLKRPFSQWSRKKRMLSFVRLLDVREKTTVLDLGGQTTFWDGIPFRLKLTILNLPGHLNSTLATHHDICYIEGDACNVDAFGDSSFDIVFSNSVIEHVGPAENQANFAREVRRLGRSFWVQTPAKWFPIEPHCGMPFWWFYPARIRHYFIERWRRILPGNSWPQMVEQTTVLTKADLIRLFPETTVLTETFLGLPKSYIAYFRGPSEATSRHSSRPSAGTHRRE
jgi:hypothetical protein